MAEEDSSDNAFSFAGHAAAPAAGTQSNSSQSFDTGGSETSELRPSTSRRPLVAPRGRLMLRVGGKHKKSNFNLFFLMIFFMVFLWFWFMNWKKCRQCKQSKTGTIHLERGDRPHDNRRLRWLRGLRRSLHLRIRLHRFRTPHHQG